MDGDRDRGGDRRTETGRDRDRWSETGTET